MNVGSATVGTATIGSDGGAEGVVVVAPAGVVVEVVVGVVGVVVVDAPATVVDVFAWTTVDVVLAVPEGTGTSLDDRTLNWPRTAPAANDAVCTLA